MMEEEEEVGKRRTIDGDARVGLYREYERRGRIS